MEAFESVTVRITTCLITLTALMSDALQKESKHPTVKEPSK